MGKLAGILFLLGGILTVLFGGPEHGANGFTILGVGMAVTGLALYYRSE